MRKYQLEKKIIHKEKLLLNYKDEPNLKIIRTFEYQEALNSIQKYGIYIKFEKHLCDVCHQSEVRSSQNFQRM